MHGFTVGIRDSHRKETFWSQSINRILINFLLALVCLLPISASAAGERLQNDITFKGPGGEMVEGIRCGTRPPTPKEAQLVRERISRYPQKAPLAFTTCNIHVAFHVVRHDDGSADVSDALIDDQIDVLNAAYESHGFQFVLDSVQRVNNTAWSTHYPGYPEEAEMKNALAVDPAHTLNLYACDLGGGILGYATFPFYYPEDSYMHGVVILYSSVPGGGADPYDEGDTATHEIGHYLGLYHTFQNGCSAPGDEVDDTPYEESPAFGCPVGRDTCTQPGLDPIENYMDYSDDACMVEFTPEQKGRMDALVAEYKPSLLQDCDGGCIVPCAGDESGTLNLVDTTGAGGSESIVTVEINNAANAVEALGFNVAFDPSCLEFTGAERGDLTAEFDFFDCNLSEPGVLTCGGFDVEPGISQGASGAVVKLTFRVTTSELDEREEAVRLELQDQVDDIADWPRSAGFICGTGGCSCDVNADAEVTPGDALCAFQKYLEICPTGCGPCEDICCDVTQDNDCTPADALEIFREYLEQPSVCSQGGLRAS